MANKDFLRKALSKLRLTAEDRPPAGAGASDESANREKDLLRELQGLNTELKEREEFIAGLQLDLAAKASELKSSISREREEYRARHEKQEKEYSAREKEFMDELQSLRETAARRENELNRLNLELKDALDKHKSGREEIEACNSKISDLHAALRQADFSLKEKNKQVKTAVTALERMKKESETNFEKLSGRENELYRLRTGLENAGAGMAGLQAALNAKEREFAAREKALVAEAQNFKDAAGRREAELAAEIKNLEETRAGQVQALELALKDKEQAVSRLQNELAARLEEHKRAETGLSGKIAELRSLLGKEREDLRADYDSLEKDFNAREKALAGELQSLKGAAGRREAELAAEIKNLEETRAGQVQALELALKDKEQAVSGLRGELAARLEERKRAETEFSGKIAELRSLLGKEREDFRADYDSLEKDFNAREKALITELQSLKESAARVETECGRLGLQLKAVTDRHEAAAKELTAARDRIIELEELKGGADKYTGEIKKLKDLHAQELKTLELALNNKDQVISALHSERIKRREECGRLELELADKTAEFRSLIAKEREEHRAKDDALEKEYAAGLRELENLKCGAEDSADELKKSEEALRQRIQALENELNGKEQAVSGLRGELAARLEERKRAETEFSGKIAELRSLLGKEREDFRADYDSLEKDFNAREKALAGELQSLKGAAGRREAELAAETKNLEETRAGQVQALELALKDKEQAVSRLQSELDGRRQERERADLELARKTAEFKFFVAKEREEHKARSDRLEKEFTDREKSLVAELQNLKEAAGRAETESDRLGLELKGFRDKYEAEAKELRAARERIIELEKLKGGADKYANEIKKLKELYSREVKELESALNGKEQLIAALNSERIKRQEECDRLELELSDKTGGFKSLLNREREAHRAYCERLEKQCAAGKETLAAELHALKETADSKELENAELKKKLSSALEKEAVLKEEVEARTLKITEISVFNKSSVSALKDRDDELRRLEDRLEAAESGMRELENLKGAAENHAEELKKSGKLFSQRIRGLENELNGKEQAVFKLRGELAAHGEERKRAETEHAGKIAEFKALLDKEREDFRTNYGRLEKEFAAREETLLSKLRSLEKTAGGKNGDPGRPWKKQGDPER